MKKSIVTNDKKQNFYCEGSLETSVGRKYEVREGGGRGPPFQLFQFAAK